MDSATFNATEIEKNCSALGGLFQQIIADMKGSSPVWDDFLTKGTKLHQALRTTLVATSAFLDTFQKVADLATNTKGATKEIGSSLTRLCIRHRSIEKKLKEFTSAILDVLVLPLQDKKEEWRARVMQLDKEHAKEYKKARAEIKRASSDTMRLQKKLKKGKSEMQGQLNTAMQDVTDKYLLLEETEKNSVRQALMEQRGHFCHFLYCLKPVVDTEIGMIGDVSHLQEILDSLCQQAGDPQVLPPASEQVILDLKGGDSSQTYSYQTPPSSPSSLGSRKSSMCSINSLNSNSSGSTHTNSPSHHPRQRPQSQPIPPGAMRLSSVSSQDSGFTSQDALFLRPPSPSLLDFRRKSSVHDSSGSSGTGTDSGGTTPSPSHPVPPSAAVSTWANWPDPPYMIRQDQGGCERPHTISTAYERSHSRPALSSDTFQPPETAGRGVSPTVTNPYAVPCVGQGVQMRARGVHRSDPRPPSLPPPPILGPKPRSLAVPPPTVPEVSRHSEALAEKGVDYVNTRELCTIPGGGEDGAASSDDESQNTGDTRHEKKQKLARLLNQDTFLRKKTHSTSTEALNNLPQELDIVLETALSGILPLAGTPTSSSSEDGDEEKRFEKLIRNKESEMKELHRQASTTQGDKLLALTAAMQELHSCTAALEDSLTDETDTPAPNRHSMHGSSGYGTMTSTPACSEDDVQTTESDNLDTTLVPSPDDNFEDEFEKFSTIPRVRNQGISQSFRLPPSQQRPVSLAGMMIQSGTATIRRASAQGSGRAPMPPLRRNSSINATVPVVPPSVPRLPGHDGQPKRSQSDAVLESRKHKDSPIITHYDSPIVTQKTETPIITQLKDVDLEPGKNKGDKDTEENYVAFSVSSDDNDSVDDLPLPPPPEELSDPNATYEIPSKPGPPTVKRTNSIVQTHGDIMNTLNQKLVGGPKPPGIEQPIYAVPQTVSPMPLSSQYQNVYMSPGPTTTTNIYATPYATLNPQPGITRPHTSPHIATPVYPMDSPDDDVTPTGEAPPNSFLVQIRRGVSLRKSTSNDRSSPRFT